MTKNVNWYKSFPDIAIILLYIFLLDPLMEWQLTHLALSCKILMVLNIIALGLGCFSFFSLYAQEDKLLAYGKTLNSFEAAVLGLSGFISSFAFVWWLVPFAVVKGMGVKDTGFIFGMTVYFITYMAVAIKSMKNKEGIEKVNAAFFTISTTVITVFFFFFSYAFLLLTLQRWHPSFAGADYLAIICLFLFYLPLRFFLLLRPPFHKAAYASFIFSFGFLMIEFFFRLKL